jgi:hypothetical protein
MEHGGGGRQRQRRPGEFAAGGKYRWQIGRESEMLGQVGGA